MLPTVAAPVSATDIGPLGDIRVLELGQLIARELPQWRELAKAANIKLQ
jgi:hypothetical protein